mmetsp:Transcript_107987/g.271628  ORF Transcript_107987/g.271628 Transcript_107987/m.271628 type:complete len:203 (-) Transcript_107987:319-927(-)
MELGLFSEDHPLAVDFLPVRIRFRAPGQRRITRPILQPCTHQGRLPGNTGFRLPRLRSCWSTALPGLQCGMLCELVCNSWPELDAEHGCLQAALAARVSERGQVEADVEGRCTVLPAGRSSRQGPIAWRCTRHFARRSGWGRLAPRCGRSACGSRRKGIHGARSSPSQSRPWRLVARIRQRLVVDPTHSPKEWRMRFLGVLG